MTTDLVTIADTVRLPITVDQAIEEWKSYQELCQKLLDASDYQAMGKDKFRKKSGWRKLARAFNLATRIVEKEVERDELGRPTWAGFYVEASASTRTGPRTAAGYHEAHLRERCCPAAFGKACPKKSREHHDCCPVDCDGWAHWSHPGDIPATAETRATNRAISNLIGAGEVSAEEMEVDGVGPGRTTAKGSRRQSSKAPPTSAPGRGVKPSQFSGYEAGPNTVDTQKFVEAAEKRGVTLAAIRGRFSDINGILKWLAEDELRTLDSLIDEMADGAAPAANDDENQEPAEAEETSADDLPVE
jgi:hypothetical protein